MAERAVTLAAFLRTGLVLLGLSLPFLSFTLEDTWIFLAIARDFPSPDGLRGATSLSWGLLGVVAHAVTGASSDATWVLKTLSAICWVLAGLCTFRAASVLRPEVSGPRVAAVFGLMSAAIWSWSGMDTAWSMLWAAFCLWMLALRCVEAGHRGWTDVMLAASLGSVYLVRPEVIWVGPLWLLWVRSRMSSGRWLLLCAITLSTVVLSALTYLRFTGSFAPTSSSKIGLPGFMTMISVAWFALQTLPLWVSSFGLMPVRRDARSPVLTAILIVSALRLFEHVALGGIDHRPLAVLTPCLVLAWALLMPSRLSHVTGLLLWGPLGVLYMLNVDNAWWYAGRTDAVHQRVVQQLEKLPVGHQVGTDEVGLVAYKLGVSRVLDHHHLIGKGLSSPADADVLVFTGSLYRDTALSAGFHPLQIFCFDARPTLYVRSVGITPRSYCKTLYQR